MLSRQKNLHRRLPLGHASSGESAARTHIRNTRKGTTNVTPKPGNPTHLAEVPELLVADCLDRGGVDGARAVARGQGEGVLGHGRLRGHGRAGADTDADTENWVEGYLRLLVGAWGSKENTSLLRGERRFAGKTARSRNTRETRPGGLLSVGCDIIPYPRVHIPAKTAPCPRRCAPRRTRTPLAPCAPPPPSGTCVFEFDWVMIV